MKSQNILKRPTYNKVLVIKTHPKSFQFSNKIQVNIYLLHLKPAIR